MRWIFFLLSFFVTYAAVAQNVSNLSYDGETVARTEIVTDPRIDTTSLQHLIQQGSGQPYSHEKVEASAEALKKAGHFTGVKTQVTPEAAGLRLTFILEPAYYVGILRFPGASRRFRYTRLLQAANIPDEAVFNKNDVPPAQAALMNFFREQGYFETSIKPETQLDDAHRLANVIFHITLGKRAKIGSVKVTGASPEENQRMLESMQTFRATFTRSALKPGKTFSAGRIKAAGKHLHDYLSHRGFLVAHVDMAPPQYDQNTNRANLTFNVTEGPEVHIRVTGAHFSWIPFLNSRQKKKLIPIYSEGSVDRDLVSEGSRDLVDYFESKGYFNVKVNISFTRKDNVIDIGYIVQKGKKQKVSRISFSGNRHIEDDELKQYLKVEQAHFFSHGKYSPKLLDQSVKNVADAYKNAGFESVQVKTEVINHQPNIGMTFVIEEGPRTMVAGAEVVGNKNIPVEQLHKQPFAIQAGKPFSPAGMSHDRDRILATYLDQGYLNAEVNAKVDKQPGNEVNVTYQVNEHQQIRISNVTVLGEDHTREDLIYRFSGMGAGYPLSQGRMLEGESALYELGIFDWSSIGPAAPITNQTREQAVIKVHEAKRNSITYGFGFEVTHRGANVPNGTVAVPGLPTIGLGNAKVVPSENTFASPRGTIEYTRSNLRGRAETATISLLAARLDQRALLTYTNPHFRESQWSTLLSGSVERTTENPLFAARIGDGSLQFERTLDRAKSIRAQFRYEFNRTVLSDLVFPELVLPEDRAVRLSTVSAALIRDTRDKPLDAHRGVFQTVNLAITPSAFGSSADFTRFFGQYAFYKPLSSVVWATSFRLGLASPFLGSHVPTSERFFAGGGTTLRGFPLNGAGPQRIVPVCGNPSDPATCSDISVPVGGNQLFIFNTELRAPLPIIKNLGIVAFYDGGNVYQNINFRQYIDDYTNTPGIGLRYNTPIGPVRFDIGHNLNPVPGVKATQYFITLGQAF